MHNTVQQSLNQRCNYPACVKEPFLEINIFLLLPFFRPDVDQRYFWCGHAHSSFEVILM